MRPRALALALLVGCSALLVVASTGHAQTITLRFGHYQPRGPAVEGEGWFAEELARRTNGRVKIEIGWAEAFGKTRELPDTVKSGAVDLATVFAPAEAVAAGFLDEVVPAGEVVARAHEVARSLAELDHAAHAATKLRSRAAALEAIRAGNEADQVELSALL